MSGGSGTPGGRGRPERRSTRPSNKQQIDRFQKIINERQFGSGAMGPLQYGEPSSRTAVGGGGRWMRQLLRDQLERDQAMRDGATPTDPSGGGYGGGGSGGGGGYNPTADMQAVDARQMAGQQQVNQISAETAMKLKAIQDQYNTQAQAATAGIAQDTNQLRQQFGQQVGGLRQDLGAQGFSAAPIGQEAVVQQQALKDAQLRGSNFAQQLQASQNANFADRNAGQQQLTQGYTTTAARTPAAA